MKILINASNLKKGGGLQVADSICGLLYEFPQHQFVVVLSSYLDFTEEKIKHFENVEIIRYDLPKSMWLLLTGNNKLLDKIVTSEQIDGVLTVFGPSLWIPKVLHISGFARAHCVLPDSPYYSKMSTKRFFKSWLEKTILTWSFSRCSSIYFTENKFISDKLASIFPSKKVYTVTNYYNQIFDDESQWSDSIMLEPFNGVTLLTISANYPHKNLSIIIPTIHYLLKKYPNLLFRFVLTITKDQFPSITQEEEKYIVFLGVVSLSECPNLYNQCDIVFSPTLLECFSAVYPEAMRMNKPIITTELNFSKSLCGEAALYYEAISPEALGEAIYIMATDKKMCDLLIENGKEQLKKYDNYEKRAEKLITLLETEFHNKKS